MILWQFQYITGGNSFYVSAPTMYDAYIVAKCILGDNYHLYECIGSIAIILAMEG